MEYALITERLALRPVTAADHLALLAHWTLPDVRRFLFDGEALSAAEVSQTSEESVSDFAAGGYGIWLIREHGQAVPADRDLADTDLADTDLVGTDLVGTVGLRPLDDTANLLGYTVYPVDVQDGTVLVDVDSPLTTEQIEAVLLETTAVKEH